MGDPAVMVFAALYLPSIFINGLSKSEKYFFERIKPSNPEEGQ